jgi:hypothetical protein
MQGRRKKWIARNIAFWKFQNGTHLLIFALARIAGLYALMIHFPRQKSGMHSQKTSFNAFGTRPRKLANNQIQKTGAEPGFYAEIPARL